MKGTKYEIEGESYVLEQTNPCAPASLPLLKKSTHTNLQGLRNPVLLSHLFQISVLTSKSRLANMIGSTSVYCPKLG